MAWKKLHFKPNLRDFELCLTVFFQLLLEKIHMVTEVCRMREKYPKISELSKNLEFPNVCD